MLQSVVDLDFRYNLPSFLVVSDHCLPIFLITFIVKSSSTSSHHLLDGLPILVPSIVAVVFCFGILSTWPYHISQRVFVNFTICASCNVFFISLFVLILQLSSFTHPHIFLTIFCSNILSTFVSSRVILLLPLCLLICHHHQQQQFRGLCPVLCCPPSLDCHHYSPFLSICISACLLTFILCHDPQFWMSCGIIF